MDEHGCPYIGDAGVGDWWRQVMGGSLDFMTARLAPGSERDTISRKVIKSSSGQHTCMHKHVQPVHIYVNYYPPTTPWIALDPHFDRIPFPIIRKVKPSRGFSLKPLGLHKAPVNAYGLNLMHMVGI